MEMRARETVRIDVPSMMGNIESITITLEHKTGQVARLRICASDLVAIMPPREKEFTVLS